MATWMVTARGMPLSKSKRQVQNRAIPKRQLLKSSAQGLESAFGN